MALFASLPERGTSVLWIEKDVTALRVRRDGRLLGARYHDLLESTPDGIVLADRTGHVVIANSHAEHLFGYGHGELDGQPVEMLLPERLRELQALTVAHRMLYADMVFVHKCLHGKVNVELSDLGLVPLASCTRANGCRLAQRHSNSKTSQLFCIRAACKWNKLPPALVSCRSLSMFKILLHNHLFLSQS